MRRLNLVRNQSQLFVKRVVPRFSSSTTSPPRPYLEGDKTHFGFEDIKIEHKEARVRNVFENVATSYDLMNDLMSGGLHRLWKDHFVKVSSVASMARIVREASPQRDLKILDVAGGTGDIAFRFVDACGCDERSKSSGSDEISITVCDINIEMLRVGEKRARDRYGNAIIEKSKALSFVQGNAQDLCQFEDNSFDMYTIAFGLRNVTDVDKALQEANRVLKPGGRFMCLEFSEVPNQYFRMLYDSYSFSVIPTMGELFADDRSSYQYLVESIRQFSNQEELKHRMEAVGMENVKFTNVTGGIVAIHEGFKEL
mmetsp:Transcript_6143/g.9431  ORF Transcript_6143/g.9431 Transcript_6143/m.9431 type:complete len:312 (-) Transcript_6143:103-1038(-)